MPYPRTMLLLKAEWIVLDLNQFCQFFCGYPAPSHATEQIKIPAFQVTSKQRDDNLPANRSLMLTDVREAVNIRYTGERKNGNTAMQLTDALLGEHGAFRTLLDGIEEMASYAGEVARIESAMAVFTAEVTQHAKLEEELLFPVLEPRLDLKELFAEMHSEHREIQSGLESIEDARDLDQAIDAVQHTLEATRRHFTSEEKELYPIAKKVLDEETLTRLGADWAAVRAIKIG